MGRVNFNPTANIIETVNHILTHSETKGQINQDDLVFGSDLGFG